MPSTTLRIVTSAPRSVGSNVTGVYNPRQSGEVEFAASASSTTAPTVGWAPLNGQAITSLAMGSDTLWIRAFSASAELPVSLVIYT